jgi:tetratricopeptide (TPR) repeat protein
MYKQLMAIMFTTILVLSANADKKLDQFIHQHKYQKALLYIDKRYPPDDRSIELWLKAGEISEGLGMSEKALGCYLAVIRKETRNESALWSLSLLYNRMGLYPNAYTMVRSLLQTKANDLGVLWEAAMICIKLNKYEEAKEYLLRVYKTNVEAQKELGNIYYAEGRYEDAMPLLKFYFSRNRDMLSAKKIVDYYKTKDKIDDAVEYFKYVADNDRKDTIAKLHLARYWVRMSENATAMKYYVGLPESIYGIEDYYNIGSYRKAEGKINDAVQFYSIVLDKSKPGSELFKKTSAELGLIYIEQKDYKKAVEHLESVKDMVPDYDLHMARAYNALNMYDKAEEYANRFLVKNPTNIMAKLILVTSYEQRGYVTKSKQLMAAILAEDPKNSSVNFEMGTYYYENGQYSKAIKNFEKSYLMNQDIVCMERIAFCAYIINQTDKAKEASEVVLESKPGNKTALEVLYKIYLKKNKYNNAVVYLEALNRQNPMNIGYLYALSLCYDQLKDTIKTIGIDEKIIEIDQDNVKSKRRLAEYRFKKERYADALNLYNDLIRMNKIETDDYPKVIKSALKVGIKPMAINYLKQYSLLKPRDADIHKDIGRLSFELDRYDDALSSYLKALYINPSITGIYNNYSKLIVIKKWDAQSIIYVSEKAVSLKEADFTVYRNLGDAYLQTGNYQKALINYQQAMVLNPRDIPTLSKQAICQVSTNKVDEAILTYEQLVILDTVKNNYKILGDLYDKKGNKKEAVSNYKKYLKNKEDDRLATYVAMYLHDEGKYAEALTYFSQMSIFSQITMYARGESYYKSNNYKEVLPIMLSFIKRYPSSKDYYIANKILGASLDKLNKPLAVSYYQAYLRKNLDSDIAYRVGELQEKIDKRSALVIYENNSKVYLKDWRNFVKMGELTINHNKSVSYYEKAVELNDTLLEVWLKLGNIYDTLHEEDKKIAVYKRAIALSPNNFEANKYLGITLFDKGNNKESLLYLELARGINIKDPYVLFTLGKCYIKEGKALEATSLLKAARDIQIKDPEIRYVLTGHMMSQQLFQEALEESNALIKIKETKEYFEQHINILFQLKKYPMIEAAVKIRRQRDPENIDLLMTLAKAQYLNGEFDEALQSYVMISFIKEGYEPAYIGRAEAYLKMGKTENAKVYYEKVIAKNPKSLAATLGLSLLFKALGDQDSFVIYLRKAYDINPNDKIVQKEMENINKDTH